MLLLALLLAAPIPAVSLDDNARAAVQILAEHPDSLQALLKNGRSIRSITLEQPEPLTTVVRAVAEDCHITIAGFHCKGGARLVITRKRTPTPDTDGEVKDTVALEPLPPPAR